MNKTLIAVALILTLTGCGYFERFVAYATSYALICVRETDVMYVQFSSGAAVLVDSNGKPKTCR